MSMGLPFGVIVIIVVILIIVIIAAAWGHTLLDFLTRSGPQKRAEFYNECLAWYQDGCDPSLMSTRMKSLCLDLYPTWGGNDQESIKTCIDICLNQCLEKGREE